MKSTGVDTLENNNLLTGAVLLETMWRARKQDLVDLISPLVFYSVAKSFSPHDRIDNREVRQRMRSEFGYKDLPTSIVEQVFVRNPRLFQKDGNQFTLIGELDSFVQDIEKRRIECDEKIDALGTQIGEYLSLHMRDKKEYTAEEGANYLQQFFSRHGAYLGVDKLEEHLEEIKKYEIDFHIAQYIFSKKDTQEKEFQYVIDLVKGYFLRSAIYLQGENGDFLLKSYKDVSFYYDTPFILMLLGYKPKEDEENAIELHTALRKQLGKTFYFSQNKGEIERILNAYKRDLGRATTRTLEGLDEKGYKASDVERIKQSWEARLKDEFETTIATTPVYSNACKLINQDDLCKELAKSVRWYTETSRDVDIESSIDIHILRNGNDAGNIEQAQHVFVTTNKALAKAFNSYYKTNISEGAFSPLITDYDLAALTWIKSGSVNNLPERELLRNAYIATQPTPEMLEKFAEVLEQMEAEGKITEETAVAIRTYGYTTKQVLYAGFDGVEEINEDLVERIQRMLREEYSKEARKDERRIANSEKQAREHELLENARRRAKIEAAKAMDDQLAKERNRVKWASIILLVLSIGGAVWTVKDFSGWLLCLIIPFILVTAKSVYDTVKATEKGIDSKLKKRASKTHDNVFDEKYREYKNVIAEKANG